MSDSYSAGKNAEGFAKEWKSRCPKSKNGRHTWKRDDWNPGRFDCKDCHEVIFNN
jgi:hypothetical protein